MFRRKAVSETAYTYDDDYMRFIELKKGKKKIKIDRLLYLLRTRTAIDRYDGILVSAIAESEDRMHWGKTRQSTGRSGMFSENHYLVNDRYPASWNMYTVSKNENLVTNEDIVSTLALLLKKEFRVCRGIAVIGDRLSNNPMDVSRADGAFAVLCTSPNDLRPARQALQTKFDDRSYNGNENGAWLEPLANAFRQVRDEYRVEGRLPGLNDNGYIFKRAFHLDPTSRFADVYQMWIVQEITREMEVL